jgi:uncharacterized protein (TIGR03435 family)
MKICILLVLAAALCGQEFDVATIKPSAPGSIAKSFHSTLGGGLETTGSTLRDLIVIAYDVVGVPIQGGPPWAAVDRYDVTAKVTEGEGDPAALRDAGRQTWNEGIRLRTSALLASRFNLAVHKETRELAMYELHVDRNGPKAALKETDLNLGISQMRWDEMVAKGAYMAGLVGILKNIVQKPLVDKTGLTGRYSYTLRWSPDQFSAVPGAPTGNPGNLPSIFTAVREQLGLRLDSTKGPWRCS